MSKVKVSVIIPAKNRSCLVERAVKSVLAQKGEFDLEIVLIDDGSKPALSKIIGEVTSKTKLIRNNKSLGATQARNQGLEIANGELVAFLDSDDWWKDDCLLTAVKVLNRQKDMGGVMFLSKKVFEGSFGLMQMVKISLFNLIKDTFLHVLALVGKSIPASLCYLCQLSHMIVRRENLKGIRFNKDYTYCEDWDFALNLLKQARVVIVAERKIVYSYSPNSLSFITNPKDKRQYYEKFIKELGGCCPKSVGLWIFKVYSKYLLIGK